MASCVSGELIPRAFVWHDPRNYPMLQKSPRRSCRIKIRNNRIGANGFLNQRCALTPDRESILRTQTGKILLQQNRHEAPVRCDAPIRSLSDVKRTWRAHRERVDAPLLTQLCHSTINFAVTHNAPTM